MLPLLLQVLVVVALCPVGYSKDNISICVQDGKAAECQQQNVDCYISDLSELNNYSNKKTLFLYLTDGNYSLMTSLHFRNKELTIQTALNTEMGIIHCINKSHITLDEQKYLLINQLSFHNCNIKITSVENCKEISIIITDSAFHDGFMNITFSSKENHLTLNIHNCMFRNQCAIILDDVNNSEHISEVNVINSSFSGTDKTCGYHESAVSFDMEKLKMTIMDSNFTKNIQGALAILTFSVTYIEIDNCLISNNGETALKIINLYDYNSSVEINSSKFINNAKAVLLYDMYSMLIDQCSFIQNSIATTTLDYYVADIRSSNVTIANSKFSENYNQKENVECSSIYIHDTKTTTIDNLTITNNNCTGITLDHSNITIRNSVNLTGNIGYKGALQILSSKLIMSLDSQLNVVNNTAKFYGGGIFIDEKCNHLGSCCFQIHANQSSSKTFFFSGNKAQWGGDTIYGGCFVNCHAEIKGKEEVINAMDLSNIFWNFTTVMTSGSESFNSVCKPTRVVFCTPSGSDYNNTMTITIVRGQKISVPLMTVDDNFLPSAQFVVAKSQDDHITILPNFLVTYNINCSNYSLSVSGHDHSAPSSVDIEFRLQIEINKSDTSSAKLKVYINECPIGFHLDNKGACKCVKDSLYFSDVKCMKEQYKLEVPELTWIGRKNGTSMHMVAKHCLYCRLDSSKLVLNDSNELCILNRAGILCGKCTKNQSLLLSGDRCGDCRGSTLQGAMLTVLLAIIAILLIIMLLTLNLTVSTGMVNALVFYSNVVYIHHNDFLPPLSIDNSNLIRFLSGFPAWISLDLHLSVCSYENYNTYIHTWSQFTYPIYIWLLILLIVCASRYSRRLAKLTASNIVPVLATLLLLSYTKLLAVSINVFSYTELHHINGTMYANSKVKVWKLDGSLDYAKDEHLPLFLMSILMTVAYIIPFTLLVLLGPLLQAKSHHRLLSWINKLKPLMDAFYGPYSNRYRYWPGILLLARVVLFTTFAITDGTITLATITSMVIVLLILWFVLGRNISNSPYQKTCYLNYLELFFLFNLGTFSIATEAIRRFDKTCDIQPALAVTMAGSTFVVFCCLMAYQTAQAMLKFKAVQRAYKVAATHKFTQNIGVLILRQKATPTATQETRQRSTEETCTRSTVAMAECTESVELREPLLTTSLNL